MTGVMLSRVSAMSEAEIDPFPSSGSGGAVLLSGVEVASVLDPAESMLPADSRREGVGAGSLLGPLLDLDANWDGYGALAPSPGALSLAAKFLNSARDRLPVPDVMASVAGGVILEWESSDVDLILEVGPLGAVTAHVRRGDLAEDGMLAELEPAVAEAIGVLAALR
jgi:hypothetical protein